MNSAGTLRAPCLYLGNCLLPAEVTFKRMLFWILCHWRMAFLSSSLMTSICILHYLPVKPIDLQHPTSESQLLRAGIPAPTKAGFTIPSSLASPCAYKPTLSSDPSGLLSRFTRPRTGSIELSRSRKSLAFPVYRFLNYTKVTFLKIKLQHDMQCWKL